MAFSLQQIVVPVAVLGSQSEPANFDDWMAYLNTLLADMRTAMPCKGFVRLSPDLAERVFGENMPLIDPYETVATLAQQAQMSILLDRTLPANTARLE